MTDYTKEYVNLLIKQYWNKPNASAEIELQAGTWERIANLLRSFPEEFDVDVATGDRLDIIGRIVGINRIVPLVVPKIAFGFDENDNARSFDDKFAPLADRAPFAEKFARQYTDLELDDPTYRIFIKAKIAKNVGDPYIATDEGINIQSAVITLFGGLAYVVDNKDMTLTLYVSPTVDEVRLNAILTLDLLPKPQGVRYYLIIQAAPFETFGFADNDGALGFKDKFNPTTEPGGRFANKVVI